MNKPTLVLAFKVPTKSPSKVNSYPGYMQSYLNANYGGPEYWDDLDEDDIMGSSAINSLLGEELTASGARTDLPGSEGWMAQNMSDCICPECSSGMSMAWSEYFTGFQVYCVNCGLSGPAKTDPDEALGDYRILFEDDEG